jgi:hypothetical protein
MRSELEHTIQHVGSNGDFGRLSAVRLRPEPITDDAFPSRDISLDQGAIIVARGLLPAHAAALSDALQMTVPLCRCSLRCFAWHCARTWWYDHGCLGMPCRDLGVNIVLVVRAITGDGCDLTIDLLEQEADLSAVISIMVGQHRRHDPARVSVRGKVQLAPAAAPPAAVFLDQPLAGSTKLQPRAVHQQVYGLATRLRARQLQRLGPAAHGGVVRHGEIEAEQLQGPGHCPGRRSGPRSGAAAGGTPRAGSRRW